MFFKTMGVSFLHNQLKEKFVAQNKGRNYSTTLLVEGCFLKFQRSSKFQFLRGWNLVIIRLPPCQLCETNKKYKKALIIFTVVSQSIVWFFLSNLIYEDYQFDSLEFCWIHCFCCFSTKRFLRSRGTLVRLSNALARFKISLHIDLAQYRQNNQEIGAFLSW